MNKNEVVHTYLRLLQDGNYQELTALFMEGAVVNSPLYGRLDADTFYRLLASDTSESRLSFKDLFASSEGHKIALLFDYHWRLSNGAMVDFEVVDIFEFDNANKIKELTIIYDASKTKHLITKANIDEHS